MVQALVFAIGAVTRIEWFADHFTVRWRQRGHLPLAAVAGVRGKRYCLALTVVAGVICRTGPTGLTFCRLRQLRGVIINFLTVFRKQRLKNCLS